MSYCGIKKYIFISICDTMNCSSTKKEIQMSNQTKDLLQKIAILKQQLESATNYAIELESELALHIGCSVEDIREEHEIYLIEE